jgi:segregation and condensation protein A
MTSPDGGTLPFVPQAQEPQALLLRLDGFEGPLDLLLDLARAQKVDLAKLSILALVDQYLAVIEGARRIRLELAAEWLVMAAWLTWLKSRLLLPPEAADAGEGEIAAEVLAGRLQELQAMRTAAAWLGARPVLGQDVFARGAPEDFTETDRSRLALDLASLLRAYLGAARRGASNRRYRPPALTLWTVQDALMRLKSMLGSLPDRISLARFLPAHLLGGIQYRGALASTLIAGLELARSGALALHQEEPFGPILVSDRREGFFPP